MTQAEAIERAGLQPHQVAEVREHPGDCYIVTPKTGRALLVSPTVVRAYVPEVDDEPVRATEPDTSAADAKPAPRTRKAAR